MKPLVSIIIVTWNGKKHLQKCFSSLQKQSFKHVEVILVDNASEDDSVSYIRTHYPKTVIVKNEKNFGFAQANNIGYKKARGKYILFLNNDTEVTKNFLTELVKSIEQNKNIAGVQSKIKLMDYRNRLDSVGAFLTWSGFLYHYGIGKLDQKKYDKEIDLFSAKGACMMFRKDILKKVEVNGEIFDSDYFAYFEETDLCHRVWLAGYRIIFVPKSVIYHKMGATSSILQRPFTHYHSFKNRISSYIKNFEIYQLLLILIPHLVICEVTSIMFLLYRKWQLFFSIQKAIIWNIQNLQKTLQKRDIVQQNIRKTNDKDLKKILFRSVRLDYFYYLFVEDVAHYKD